MMYEWERGHPDYKCWGDRVWCANFRVDSKVDYLIDLFPVAFMSVLFIALALLLLVSAVLCVALFFIIIHELSAPIILFFSSLIF